jgi:leucyl/phenylalanyl-tRNA--protein transferase
MYFPFPDPNEWIDDIVAIGGNLSPGVILSAYEQGVFPWYNPGDPIIWQSPDPRLIIFSDDLHVSKSMNKVLNQKKFDITFNRNFAGVIRGCAETERPYQGDANGEANKTWITEDMITAFIELHRLGWALSAEAWQDGELVGGCYGILMERAFFGESMFSKKTNASKAAFITMAQKLFAKGIEFIDCQTPSKHLISLGGKVIPRSDFLEILDIYEVVR